MSLPERNSDMDQADRLGNDRLEQVRLLPPGAERNIDGLRGLMRSVTDAVSHTGIETPADYLPG